MSEIQVPEDLAEVVPHPKLTRLPEGVALVDLRPEHSEQVNALFNRVFGEDRSLAHYDWKFWQNPAGPPVGLLAVSEDDGRVLAANLGQRKRFWVDGHERGGVLICESASDPDVPSGGRLYRNATIATGYRGGELGLPISMGGQSTEEAIRIGERWFGYRVLFTLKPWLRRLSYAPALRLRLGGAGGLLARVADRALRKRLLSADEVVPMSGTFGEDYRAFFERVRDRYRILPWRDRATLQWRYTDCPVGEQHTIEYRRAGELEGYLILRAWIRSGIRVATVLDLLDGQDAAVAALLLQGASGRAAELGCEFIEFSPMPGSSAEQGVRDCQGFQPSARERPDKIIVTPLPRLTPPEPWYYQVQRTVVRASNWYYTQGDCDYRD